MTPDNLTSAQPRGRFGRAETYAQEHLPLILTIMVTLVFLAGLSVLKANPPAMGSGETTSWWGIATNLERGYGYSLCNQYYFPFCDANHAATAMREPAPVLLFAGVALFTHESFFAAGIVELILLIAVMLALFFLTLEWTQSALAALIASALWALYPNAYSLITQVSGDLMAALGVTLGIFFVLRARRTNQWQDWVLAGVGLGLAWMSRSAMMLIAVTVIVGLMLESRGKNLRASLILALTVALFVSPWLIRTQLVFGRPLLGSSLVGYNIYRHNYDLGTNDYLHYVGNLEGWNAIQDLVQRRTDLSGTENEAQMDAVYRDEGLKIIVANPVHYVLLSGYRFFMLWFDWRVSEGFGYPMGFNEYALLVLQVILLTLAMFGLKNNVRLTWVMWASLIMVTLAYMAVDSRMLYTGPIMPLVMSLGAAGFQKIARV